MPKPLVVSAAVVLALVAGSVHAIAQESAPAAPPASEPEKPKAAPAAPQDAAAKEQDSEQSKMSNSDLLSDFEHYVFIEQVALATSMGQGLLDRHIAPADFVKLVEDGGAKRFEEAYVRAVRHASLEPVAAKLWTLYQDGKRETVRSPAAVAENIKLLTGSQRQRSYARDRLMEAKEYAMPQLLQALLQRQDSRLSGEARQVIVEMGRDAVTPLCTALPQLDSSSQLMVAEMLGDVGYPTALPFLYDTLARSGAADVKQACEDAIRKIAQVVNPAVPIADRYVDLAEGYYDESPSLTIFPGESHQLLWSYNPGAGLIMQAIPTPVFHEAMAMRYCETALRDDPSNARAVPLWLASNFSREIDTPADPSFTNPAYPADRRDAMYYAVAAGSGPTQQVLARGLGDNDTPLVRKALAALEKTAGGSDLWAGVGDSKPLLGALRYPNRRVQYEAALALGSAGPREAFDGSDQVVRILGSAIRDASAKYALVFTTDTERGAMVGDILRGQGYTVEPQAVRLDDAAQSIADAPGIDLIVTILPGAQTAELIDQAQAGNKLRATPILALVSAQGYADQASKYVSNPRVRMLREGVAAADIGEAAKQIVEQASGGAISPEEADAYKARALSVLRDLAISANPVLNVADASGPLVSALANATGDTKARVCEVLSHINTKAAQQAVVDAALAASGEEQVALLTTAAGSAKRFGNQLEPRQVSAIREVALGGDAAAATAAAALLGSLNLPNTEIVPMILGTADRVAGGAK